MVTPHHVCPWGLKALDLLEHEGVSVDDHYLRSRDETDAFKREYHVETTPQIFIDGKRIGGYEALREHFGKHVRSAKETTYRPIVAIFSMAAVLAIAVSWSAYRAVPAAATVRVFVGLATSFLALQKLRDVESFSTMFLNYDLLARRWVRYAYVYPFAEATAGVLMVAGALWWLAGPIAVVIGGIGAVSVFKAVYVDKRELKCACVGGSSNVPLGFVSLTEDLMMVAMGIWLAISHAAG
ncbi:MAG TPA: glutaredoxin family protein [Kofleriaceae bacterium]|jgi:glutaredoxin